MTKLKKDDLVTGTHPALGGTANGVVLMDDLKGLTPLLVKFNTPHHGDMCVQTDLEGGGFIKLRAPADNSVSCIAIVYADGGILPFQPTSVTATNNNGQKMVAAIRAKRNADGTYSDFSFENFADEGDGGTVLKTGEQEWGGSPATGEKGSQGPRGQHPLRELLDSIKAGKAAPAAEAPRPKATEGFQEISLPELMELLFGKKPDPKDIN